MKKSGNNSRSKSCPNRSKGISKIYGGPNMYPLASCPGWFTSAVPPHLQTDEDKFVIRWESRTPGYFTTRVSHTAR